MEIPLTWNLPQSPPAPTLVLTHGAGASSTHPNTTALAELIAQRGVRVARFDFPYMRRAMAEGRRPWPPDPEDVLAGTWVQVIQQLAEQGVPTSKLFFGGRSMGGRIASYIADAVEPAGMVCISYPFHAPNNPASAITIHLEQMATPTLIVQGERDEYGTREEVEGYDLSTGDRAELDSGWQPRSRAAEAFRAYGGGESRAGGGCDCGVHPRQMISAGRRSAGISRISSGA